MTALLFHISKEHQITTRQDRSSAAIYCFTFQKSIKSQLDNRNTLTKWHCFTFQKSIKSQHSDTDPFCSSDCFTFQKSIKSQQERKVIRHGVTVSHFKRASNHNSLSLKSLGLSTVSHFKRASNHNTDLRVNALPLLFHISKEHQITTVKWFISLAVDCFTFQKSIKSQPVDGVGLRPETVSHFKRASNHNSRNLSGCSAITVSHFKRASNHNKSAVDLERFALFHISKEHQITTYAEAAICCADCFTFQKSIKSQPLQRARFELFHCFTFQKSIKSQRDGRVLQLAATVSHFKRASNHNVSILSYFRTRTVSHFKRASNHNLFVLDDGRLLLFHISKEHQITTSSRPSSSLA